MKRILIAGTATFLLAIMIGTAVAQDNLVQAFASSEPVLQVIRLLLIGLLASLFFTSPPRNIYFRLILGVCSVFLAVGSIAMLVDYYMLVLDTLIFIEIAIIFVINAIESPASQKNHDNSMSVVSVPRTKKALI